MKIAILGNYAIQFLCKPLKNKINNVELYLVEFDTVDLELIDFNSNLFQFTPEFIIWHESTLGLRNSFYKLSQEERINFSINYINRISHFLKIINDRLPNCRVVFPDHSLIFHDNVLGNYFYKDEESWQYQINKTNYLLIELSNKTNNLYLINSTPPNNGLEITDYSQVVNAELHFTIEYLKWLTSSISKVILSLQGSFIKCIILDLDNTLWGGVVGDDGIEQLQIGSLGIGKAFSQFQLWLKELKNRGVILAVCSKNDEDTAKAPFLYHPEMILKLEDIAVFIANWDSKSDNINHIQKVLNISFDSMVFIDDNPAEREIVRTYIPKVIVPELPLDPSNYLPFLINQNLFEITGLSKNDNQRTIQYQQEAKRVSLSKSITNIPDYLISLEMKANIDSFKSVDFERIAQLTQRSNQFNLRTIRYNSNDIQSIANDKNYITFAVELDDKFGNYGLISLVIVKLNSDNGATIDTWIMSCRVLKRTVEHFVMNEVVQKLNSIGIKYLIGEYISTEKNKLVSRLLEYLGMTNNENNSYYLELKNYSKLTTYIK